MSKSFEPSRSYIVRGHTGRYEEYSTWMVGCFHIEAQAEAFAEHLNKLYKEDRKNLDRFDPDIPFDDGISYNVQPVVNRIWSV